MTPDKAEAILRGVVVSLGSFIEELESFQDRCPIQAQHLLAAMRQSKISLEQMIERDSGD
jgi:hypothetical protein